MRNILLSLWDGHHNVAVISTTEKVFAQRLKEWAEQQGYRVEFSQFSKDKDDCGPEHK